VLGETPARGSRQGEAAAAASVPEFVEVPGGPFTMGAGPARDQMAFDNERWSSAAETGTVDEPTFYLGRTEVTVAQFAAFVRDTGWRVDAQSTSGDPTHPVTFVSWPDAVAYARWLDADLRRRPQAAGPAADGLRTGWRVTLPTEAQWEKAARGPDGRRFPWGHDPRRDRAHYEATGPRPAGQVPCPECVYGLLDMSGNVWEWTRSPYLPYPFDPSPARIDLQADALWVMRGGHFGDGARLLRGSARGAAEPGARRAFIGFRVAIVPPPRRR
jgi:formylglycine-generating enzyme required for sulfatase activity